MAQYFFHRVQASRPRSAATSVLVYNKEHAHAGTTEMRPGQLQRRSTTRTRVRVLQCVIHRRRRAPSY